MPKCISCEKSQSALNEGNLCKQCFKKPKENVWSGNLTAEKINALPALPDNWDKKLITELTAGHIITLMMDFFTPSREQLTELKEQINEMKIVNRKCFYTNVFGGRYKYPVIFRC